MAKDGPLDFAVTGGQNGIGMEVLSAIVVYFLEFFNAIVLKSKSNQGVK
jgi:hypothetical protein